MKILITIILFIALTSVVISSFCIGIMIAFFVKKDEKIEEKYDNTNDYLS